PDGLTLAATATLTIHPPSAVTDPAMVVDFLGDGADAGLHVFDRTGADVTIPIDHFSGYTFEFPVTEAGIQSFAQRYQAFLERVLETQVAAEVGHERQLQLLGEANEDAGAILAIAEANLDEFKRVVLLPRIAAASRSCTD